MTTAIYVTSTRDSRARPLCAWGWSIGFSVRGSGGVYEAHQHHGPFARRQLRRTRTRYSSNRPWTCPIPSNDRAPHAHGTGNDAVLKDDADKELASRALDAFHKIAEGRDAVVMEGGTSLREGSIIALDPPRLSRLLGAKALVVVPYIDSLQVVDDLLAAYSMIGDNFLGGVINQVPQHRMDFMREKVSLSSKGAVSRFLP